MSPQVTLAGEPTDHERTRPETILVCQQCGESMLRSQRFDHDHDVFAVPDDDSAGDDGEDDEDEPERVGSWYDITLEYTVTYRFRVAAWSEHEAKDRAEELQLDARPADSYLVHSDDREVKPIMSDDDALPDDFDPYGSTPLWEVWSDE